MSPADKGGPRIGMAQIPDRYVLADVKAEVAAAGGEHERAGNRRRPDDLAVDKTLDMLQHRISVVPRFAERGVGVSAQQHGVGSVDAHESQLAHGLRDGVGVVADRSREGHHRVAGPLADAFDPRRGIAVEDGAIFRKGQPPRGVLQGLPVRVVRAALHVIDLLAIEIERNAQFDERLHLTLSRDDIVSRRLEVAQVAGSDRREGGAGRSLHVDNATPGEIALQGARRLLLDLRPGLFRDRGKLPVKIIHETALV